MQKINILLHGHKKIHYLFLTVDLNFMQEAFRKSILFEFHLKTKNYYQLR